MEVYFAKKTDDSFDNVDDQPLDFASLMKITDALSFILFIHNSINPEDYLILKVFNKHFHSFFVFIICNVFNISWRPSESI